MNEDDAVRVTLRGINRANKKAQIKRNGRKHGSKRKQRLDRLSGKEVKALGIKERTHVFSRFLLLNRNPKTGSDGKGSRG